MFYAPKITRKLTFFHRPEKHRGLTAEKFLYSFLQSQEAIAKKTKLWQKIKSVSEKSREAKALRQRVAMIEELRTFFEEYKFLALRLFPKTLTATKSDKIKAVTICINCGHPTPILKPSQVPRAFKTDLYPSDLAILPIFRKRYKA